MLIINRDLHYVLVKKILFQYHLRFINSYLANDLYLILAYKKLTFNDFVEANSQNHFGIAETHM